jgi:chemotaxis protein CheD
MREFTCPITHKNLVWLGVDESAIIKDGKTAKTILGSCVSIILYDSQAGIFGLNHYLNVDTGYPLTEKLVTELQGLGCKNIKAVLAGGANKSSTAFKVGKTNIDFAKAFLMNYNIEVVGENVGGELGRTVMAELSDGHINLKVDFHKENLDASDKPKVKPKMGFKANSASKEAYEALLSLSKK